MRTKPARKTRSHKPPDNTEASDLHDAAWKGNVTRVVELLESGCDIDEQDGFKRTALHWAVYGNHMDVCLVLVGCGAQVSVGNKLSYAYRTQLILFAQDFLKTPLELAIYLKKDVKIIELLNNSNNAMRRHIKTNRLFSAEAIHMYRKQQWYTFLVGSRDSQCHVSLLNLDVFGIIFKHMSDLAVRFQF
eukprot:c1625_g1_i1.p1 GENE.c1625_g1_i1~~c1625_g1_i1.p1  ORF type:complete len:199 (+),score=46.03 c1625_g1_i1:32-598(+)